VTDNETALVVTPQQMMVPSVKLEELARKTKRTEKKTRVGPGGKKLAYIPWAVAARRMNEAFGNRWSREILSQDIQGGEVIVKVRVTSPLGVQDAFGGHQYRTNNPNASYSDALQSAVSKAFRRCVAPWGIGLDLYFDDEEVRDADPQVLNAVAAVKSAEFLYTNGTAHAVEKLNTALGTEYKGYDEIIGHIVDDKEVDTVHAAWIAIDIIRA
jgi:recombination DNA repair RAD52 pathway protein